MAALWSVCLLALFGYVLTSFPPLITYSHGYDYQCNDTIPTDRAFLLKTAKRSFNTSECMIQLQASPSYFFSISYYQSQSHFYILFCQNSLEIHFEEYSVNKTGCQLFTEYTPLVSLSNTLDVYIFSNISVHNETYAWYMDSDTIRLLIVPFHTGNCTREEYKCSNGRCIDRQLYCNPEYNTCGDIDCPRDDSGTTGAIIVAVIAVGCIVIITCIVGCLCCCFLGMQKRQRIRQNRLAELSLTGTHNPAHSTTFPVLTTPPYTPPYNPPPYSANPDVNSDPPLSTQPDETEKGREVTLNTEKEVEVNCDRNDIQIQDQRL